MLPGKGPPEEAAAQLKFEEVSVGCCWLPPERSGADTGVADGL